MGGDFRRQRHPERTDQIEHHLATGRSARIEPVDLPVAGVPHVMVDVDDKKAVEAGYAGALQIAALHDDCGVEFPFHGRRDVNLGNAGELHQRRRRRIGVDHLNLLAEGSQGIGHSELRPDRVAVGARMR